MCNHWGWDEREIKKLLANHFKFLLTECNLPLPSPLNPLTMFETIFHEIIITREEIFMLAQRSIYDLAQTS